VGTPGISAAATLYILYYCAFYILLLLLYRTARAAAFKLGRVPEMREIAAAFPFSRRRQIIYRAFRLPPRSTATRVILSRNSIYIMYK